MKQEMINHLLHLKEEMINISKFLYNHPEESFKEFKAYEYIVSLLKTHNFEIKEHYLQIPTAFYAQYGQGHPKVCFFCEYDALETQGHISGHNLLSAISLAAGIGLSKVIPKVGGSVIILGCPGEYTGGAKITMAKQGCFEDIDVGLLVHPNIVTAASGTSMAVLPVKIDYRAQRDLYGSSNPSQTLDTSLFLLNTFNYLIKTVQQNCIVDGIILNGTFSPYFFSLNRDLKLYLKAPTMGAALDIKAKLSTLLNTLNNNLNHSYSISLFDLPCDELITNKALSRVYEHNLKEGGIINALDFIDTYTGISLGTVSNYIPCIHPYINTVEDSAVQFPSQEFGRSTITPYAFDQAIISAQALATTALDIIQSQDLLSEVKTEFYENIKTDIK